jgi:hypothetical protein
MLAINSHFVLGKSITWRRETWKTTFFCLLQSMWLENLNMKVSKMAACTIANAESGGVAMSKMDAEKVAKLVCLAGFFFWLNKRGSSLETFCFF